MLVDRPSTICLGSLAAAATASQRYGPTALLPAVNFDLTEITILSVKGVALYRKSIFTTKIDDESKQLEARDKTGLETYSMSRSPNCGGVGGKTFCYE
jgi:hypothetical protein